MQDCRKGSPELEKRDILCHLLHHLTFRIKADMEISVLVSLNPYINRKTAYTGVNLNLCHCSSLSLFYGPWNARGRGISWGGN